MNKLLIKSSKVKESAKQVLIDLDLVKILSNAGQVDIVGSYKYDLMTWRDIDIDVISKREPDYALCLSISQKLSSSKGVDAIKLIDNTKEIELNRPKSIYLGIKYLDRENNLWKIDIRFISSDALANATSVKTEKLIKEKLNSESKLIILEIKSQVDKNPGYHKNFQSTDIYEAVLLHEVKNLGQFKEYLLSIGKIF